MSYLPKCGKSLLPPHPGHCAFQREATRRGVPPVTVNLHGGTFILWRGIPLIPSDKLFVDGPKNPKIVAGNPYSADSLRESKRGHCWGFIRKGCQNEQSRGLSGALPPRIDDNGVASYLLSLYCSAAIRPMMPLLCWKMLKWDIMTTTSNLSSPCAGRDGPARRARPSARDYGLPDAGICMGC